jgi:hypothetical protein
LEPEVPPANMAFGDFPIYMANKQIISLCITRLITSSPQYPFSKK